MHGSLKKTAIIQARMGSTRLPGKVMKIIKGKTVLEHVVERVQAAKNIDDIVIATTVKSEDDVIVELSKKLSVKYFRGDENDVLSRYYYAARQNKSDVIIRITSDCPLIDPLILENMVDKFIELNQKDGIDYMSNTVERTYPRGLDAEIFTFKALKITFNEANKDYQREHVTPYIYQNPAKFKISVFRNDIDYSGYRLTLDTKEDLEVIKEIYNKLYNENILFYFAQILTLLKTHPEIEEINKNVKQKQINEVIHE